MSKGFNSNIQPYIRKRIGGHLVFIINMPKETIGTCKKCANSGFLADNLCIKCWDRAADNVIRNRH